MPTPSRSGPSSPESILAAWLGLPDEARGEFDALCRAHPEHADELRRLFEQWRGVQGLLRERESAVEDKGSLAVRLEAHYGSGIDPCVTLSPDGPEPTPSTTSAEVLARLAGRSPASTRYRLEGEIAHGGMGAVLGVWDEDLRRHLAMKVMLVKSALAGTPHSERVDPKLLGRFLEEAQVTGQLDHPGIVPVHELGLDSEGRVYFTMKLVKGDTLKDVFEELAHGEGGWTQARVLGLLLKVCEAMSYAHAKGVIHRDLKPANVMVGRFGEVFVMDWGLSKVLGREETRDLRIRSDVPLLTSEVLSDRKEHAEDSPDSPLYTMDGDVVGTPAYMPPEQAAGRVEDIGPASDVYALGAMLYHLIAGHMPYVPPGTRANNYAIWQRVQDGPPRPLHQEAPSTPAELVAICEKAMSRDSGKRYPDMAALAADLSAYVEGRVVQAYETGAWAEAKKWVRRNKPLAAALAAGVLILFAGLVTSTGLYVRAEDNAKRAFANEQTAKDQERVAKAQERIATERAEDVLRLSALQDLQELLDEADTLWPAHPANIPAYGAWIGKAKTLVSELPRHRAKREELRALALPRTDGQSDEWRFPEEHGEARWWNAQLTQLIEGLESVESGLLAENAVTEDHGWSIAKRLAFARELEFGFAWGGRYGAAWERDLPAIWAAYPGFALTAQMGLVPIGPDPESKLWEFAHLATGAPAERGADGKLVLTEATGVVLVLIPRGRFWMGAQSSDPNGHNYDPLAQDHEGPVHEVELSPYFISKYEMTQGQWERLAGKNPSVYVTGRYFTTWNNAGQEWNLLHPVEQVSWNDCMTWLPRAGLTLPSEAQWEHGCRAGTSSVYWCGNAKESLQGVANLSDDWGKKHGNESWTLWESWLDDGNTVHAVVGSYRANAFGLHDVHGNLWEWCLDGDEEDFYAKSPLKDPVGSWEVTGFHCYRSGGYDYAAPEARAAARDFDSPSDADFTLGLRPARAVSP